MNQTIVNSDGTYQLPAEKDKTWFLAWINEISDERTAYDKALGELLIYDSEGLIDGINNENVEKYLTKFLNGELTHAQMEALKTFILAYPGYWDKNTGAEETTNRLLQNAAKAQDLLGGGWSIFGFGYNYEAQHFYTKQNSVQGMFGFGDIYDEAGALLGMDLDTEKIQFYYNGKEYRFQVWKGTYEGGTLAGGEQGWYAYDPKKPEQYLLNTASEALGQSDLVPVAAPEDRIRMVNTLFNETKGNAITQSSDTAKYAQERAYWNLDTIARHTGYTKSNIYAEGKLYIEDVGLRNEVYEQLKGTDAFSEVKITDDKKAVTYT